MARSLRPLDATIGVAKTRASAHQPSSSAASEATERVVSRGGTGVSDDMFPVPATSGLAGDQNQREKAAFERCQRSTAKAHHHCRYGGDLYLDQILFRAETTRSAGSWESRRGSLSPSYRLLCSESSKRIEWRQFGEARAFARSLSLESKEDWVEWSQSRERPRDIPADPCLVYGGEGGQWQGWPDFLGHEYDSSGSHSTRRWLRFEEAREYARSLGLKSWKEWQEWRKTKASPPDIPSHPDIVYKGEGWLSWGDFLGYNEGYVVGEWRPFEEARDYARSLSLKSHEEWRERMKHIGVRPPDIPATPDQVYKDEGWLSWGDFLGFNEGYVPGEWRPFEEARDYVRSLGLRSQKKWKEWRKNEEMPNDIPSNPDQIYKEEGWLSWGDFLGYTPGHIAEKRSRTKRLPFAEARDYVRSFCFKSQEEWREWSKSGLRPHDILATPDRDYKGKGWKSWGDFLGFNEGNVAGEWRPFEEARDYVRSLGLESKKEWWEWRKSGERPTDIPSHPERDYKDEGWLSWGDFLGYNEGYVAGQWRPFEEARDFVRSLGLKSWKEWLEWSKSGKRPPDIPSHPDRVYKGKGWMGYGDFLGYKGYSVRKRRSFEALRRHGSKSQVFEGIEGVEQERIVAFDIPSQLNRHVEAASAAAESPKLLCSSSRAELRLRGVQGMPPGSRRRRRRAGTSPGQSHSPGARGEP